MKTLQQFKDALKAILDKQEKQDDLVNKALCMEDLLQKAGKPAAVGEVRPWKNGFKYKKMADGKWRRVYDQDERTKSADNAAKRIMREIDRATDAKELWQVVSRHKGRFSKKDGTPLPIAIELRKYMADREQEVWAGIKSGKTIEARNRSAVLKNRRAMRAFPEAAIGPNLPTSKKLARLEKERLTTFYFVNNCENISTAGVILVFVFCGCNTVFIPFKGDFYFCQSYQSIYEVYIRQQSLAAHTTRHPYLCDKSFEKVGRSFIPPIYIP